MIFGRDEVTRTARGGEIRESAIARVERGEAVCCESNLVSHAYKVYRDVGSSKEALCAFDSSR